MNIAGELVAIELLVELIKRKLPIAMHFCINE